MSIRDDILVGLRASEDLTVGDTTPEQLLGAYRAKVLREVATEIGDACPDHADGDTCYLGCQCAAARDLRRMADEAEKGDAS